jgi:hypothetical protein
MIANVESQFNAEYIANVFWNQNLAQVRSITLIPYLKGTEIVQMAYIDIQYWCDSEVAYNFIQRIKVPEGEARLVHQSDDWWAVQNNTHNDGCLLVGVYTTTFTNSYFIKEDMIKETVAKSHNVTLRAHQSAYVR